MVEFTPHEAAAREALSLPVQLPSKLIGREVVLAQVYSQLKDNKPVLIYGAPGIGKTAVAATLASAYTEMPGGVLWLHTREDETFADLLARVGRAYKESAVANSENPLGMVGAVSTVLTQHKPLIVLDGRINPGAAAEFIGKCAQDLPVLLVTEEKIEGPWGAIGLEKLDHDQAATMFRHLADLDDEGDPSVGQLVARLDANPFAITMAAGAVRANKQGAADFLAALPASPPAGVGPQLLALTTAFRGLNSALQGLVLVLGATPHGEASGELVSLIGGAPLESIQQALSLLVQRGFVEQFTRYGAPYYRLHTLVSTFAHSWLRGSGRAEQLQAKVRDAALQFARRHSAAQGDAGAHNKLAAESDNFLAIARKDAAAGDSDSASQFAMALMQAGDFVSERGYVYDLLLLRRLTASSTSAFPAHITTEPRPSAAGLEPDEDEQDEEDEIYGELEDELEPLDDEDDALAYDLLDEDDIIEEEEVDALDLELDAEEDEALEVDDEDLGEPVPEEQLDAVLIGTGAFAAQEDDYADEDDEEEVLDDLEDEALTAPPPPLSSPEAAAPAEGADVLAQLRASLLQMRQAGDHRQQAELLSMIAKAQVERRMENEAIASYSEALSIFEALDDKPGILSTLEALGSLAARTDNLQAAVMHAKRGVTLAQELGNPVSQGKLLTTLGDAQQLLGESETSIRAYQQALSLAAPEGDVHAQAVILFKLGYAQLDYGTPEEAINTWEESLSLFRAQGRRDYEGRVLGGLGTAYGEMGHWTEAINFHTSALYIAREVKDQLEEALQLSNLGYASVQANQLGQAVLRYRQALHLAYVSGDRENIVSATVDLVRLLVESPRHLNIAQLLVDSALEVDPSDRDLRRLMERIEDERPHVDPQIELAVVTGTARDYAANAYAMLDA
jgi:tetratricopeptide (TPR) repeat protein/energy-coupling factor transporter ATP-binding protein EcfA2